MINEVIQVLSDLDRLELVHSRIRPDHFMVTHDKKLVLCDFINSAHFGSFDDHKNIDMSLRYQ